MDGKARITLVALVVRDTTPALKIIIESGSGYAIDLTPTRVCP